MDKDLINNQNKLKSRSNRMQLENKAISLIVSLSDKELIKIMEEIK